MTDHRYEFKSIEGSPVVHPEDKDAVVTHLTNCLPGATNVRGMRVARTLKVQFDHPATSIVVVFEVAELLAGLGIHVEGWPLPDLPYPEPRIRLDLVYASTKGERR